LREIDRRIRFLIRRLDDAEVVDPQARRESENADQIFFGATVTVGNARGEERTVSIVGVDEIDMARGYISWVSPMARALIKAREGDTVTLRTPGGIEELEILGVRYGPIATD
jgi:transcription elongation factor GreB